MFSGGSIRLLNEKMGLNRVKFVTPIFFSMILFCTVSFVYSVTTSAADMNFRSIECTRLLSGGDFAPPQANLDLEAVAAALKALLSERTLIPQDLTAILKGQNPLADQNTPGAIEFRPVINLVIAALRNENGGVLERFIQSLIDETTQTLSERSNKESETKDKFVQLTFYPIVPGRFIFKTTSPDEQVRIKHEFWIANFPVTRGQYAKIMGEEDKFVIQPNHPVASLMISEVSLFLAKLNRLSKKNDPLIYKVIPDHKKFWRSH